MREEELAKIITFFQYYNCSDTAKEYVKELVSEVQRLQTVEQAYEAMKKAL